MSISLSLYIFLSLYLSLSIYIYEYVRGARPPAVHEHEDVVRPDAYIVT